jgi:hypothetical protein
VYKRGRAVQRKRAAEIEKAEKKNERAEEGKVRVRADGFPLTFYNISYHGITSCNRSFFDKSKTTKRSKM